MIAGKVMMDRHCPEFLRDDVAPAPRPIRATSSPAGIVTIACSMP